MKKIYFLPIIGFLLALNFFCWKEVFTLSWNNYLEVTFLDVGQGDSTFVQTPEGHQILIDGGPDKSALEKISSIIPFWDKSIDLVILSHPESDHVQGLIDILQRYKADYILWTGIERSTPVYSAWIDVLQDQRERGAEIIIAKTGQKIQAGGALIDVLYPFKDLERKQVNNTSNETCIVNKIIYGENSFLLTGDINSGVEKELVGSGKDILSDVLKVAHHGSKYSTSDYFLEKVKPVIAVVEVGKNFYGHPTQETLQRLESFGIKIFRTDVDGDVKIISNGKKLTLLKY